MNKVLLICIVVLGITSCYLDDSKEHSKVRINTPYGEMQFKLYDETPNHKAMFLHLARDKHFNQFTINRVIKDFVIQGGCPDSTMYFENSPYLLEPEFSDSIKHKYGALGMGRDNNPEKLSNGCQFYVVTNENGLPRLDGEYMIFGELVEGFDVLETIEKVATDSTDTPLEDISLSVSIAE